MCQLVAEYTDGNILPLQVKSVEMHQESLTEAPGPGDDVGFNMKNVATL